MTKKKKKMTHLNIPCVIFEYEKKKIQSKGCWFSILVMRMILFVSARYERARKTETLSAQATAAGKRNVCVCVCALLETSAVRE